MKFITSMAVAVATVGVGLIPAAASATGSGSTTTTTQTSAQSQCRQELATMGKKVFKQTYGTNKNKSNAFGKCVSHRAKQDSADQSSAQTNAAKTCKAQQSDPGFATSHGGKTFAQFYGTNKNGHNAFGKCVSSVAKTTGDKTQSDQVKAEDNAAKQCRTEQKADPGAFAKKYGTNANKANAFGKCVSTKAKAQERQDQSGSNGSGSSGS